MKSYWFKSKNIGDTLTEVLIDSFTDKKLEWVDYDYEGKLLCTGSILSSLKNGDIILGAGCMYDRFFINSFENVKAYAVRGKLTRDILIEAGIEVPEVYGDPALLLPLIYNPKIKKTHDIGLIPHYIDKFPQDKIDELTKGKTYKIVDVYLPWKDFINEILSCKETISSSLHGIIISEAYKIPATWIELSDKVLGSGFKFKDYLTGTGRKIQGTGKFPPIKNLKRIQNKLLKAFKEFNERERD